MLSPNSKRIKINNYSTANNASNVNVDAFTTTSLLIADTVASDHFAEMNASYLTNIKLADPPISILCPSCASIKSTHTIEFDFDDFPPHQRVHVFPSLASGSLLSIEQLCDFGCYAIFHTKTVQIIFKIIFNNKIILVGTRSVASNGLWIVNVNHPSANEKSSCNILSPFPIATSGIEINYKNISITSLLCTMLYKSVLIFYSNNGVPY